MLHSKSNGFRYLSNVHLGQRSEFGPCLGSGLRSLGLDLNLLPGFESPRVIDIASFDSIKPT